MKLFKKFWLIVFLTSQVAFFAQVNTCQSAKKAAQTYTLYYSQANHRSDTIDILKYTINLDITDFAGQTFKGNTQVRFAPKINGQTYLRLDLLKMTIDSIRMNNSALAYAYNDTLLRVNFPAALNTTDTNTVTVYYHGHPQGDPAGWGGFSFNGNYAYNLGVGFGADPHCYGRVWFPCFDNFVEKSKYEFNIITDTLRPAYCNGQLMSDTRVGNYRLRSWVMNKEIPSYLASVAVADYTQVNWNINVSSGNIPVILTARPSDTTSMKSGFVHLSNAILGFESHYGPYVWNRVGYCLVPFNNGAMEHATNIAYPQIAIGNLAYEHDLMAHELSHHWWGDLVTCETQEDMWLNEGMASYSEKLFLEFTYNHQKYIDEVRTVHDDMVKHAHLSEKGFRAISGVPHEYTYGDHVYKKGADVAHTLRGYMGDAAFFAGLHYVQQQKAYKNMNSLEFRDLLMTSSGQNLTDFFNNWVLTGGWPHFSIDSVKTSGTSAPYTSVVYVKQKLFGAPALYSNVPLEITFMNSQWTPEVKPIVMNGTTKSFTIQTNGLPKYAGINVDNKISDAISSEYKIIKTVSNVTYTFGKVLLMVSDKGLDSSFIRVEHNFAAPDPVKVNTKNYRLNTQHYWKIDGILSTGFVSKLRLNYDGGKTSGLPNLDTCLVAANADSMIVLYRRNTADDWHEVKNYTRYKISSKTGFFTLDTLKFGEYVFANGKSDVLIGINEKQKDKESIQVFPNPANDEIHIVLKNVQSPKNMTAEIQSTDGKLVYSQTLPSKENTLPLKGLAAGVYTLTVRENSQVVTSQKIVIE
ncbi:MAG: T9SS type A sorting domain-containing protein [Bacteroidetes bacterium]|nr:T9SS type A sorting domain-containing protein [Bacteroidota bacterium]